MKMHCKLSLIVNLIFTIPVFVESKSSCGEYGLPPCKYIPAPPGSTPNCASPGKTYCESIDSYPKELMKKLLKNYKIDDINTDENVDFNELKFPNPNEFYGAPGYRTEPSHENDYNKLTYNEYNNQNSLIVQPDFANQQNEYWMHQHQQEPQQLYQNQIQMMGEPNFEFQILQSQQLFFPNFNFPQEHQQQPLVTNQPNIYSISSTNYNYQYEPNVHGLTTPPLAPPLRLNRSLGRKKREEFIEIVSRKKRQTSEESREQMCKSIVRYIMPKAAATTSGSWRYVINDVEERVVQKVRTEICESNECSGMCVLPNNFNSKCEQKYVTKRLWALDQNGENLYIDKFWFPSCCICTLGTNVKF